MNLTSVLLLNVRAFKCLPKSIILQHSDMYLVNGANSYYRNESFSSAFLVEEVVRYSYEFTLSEICQPSPEP